MDSVRLGNLLHQFHQIRQRAHLHFLHYMGTVNFNGTVTEIQLEGDDFIRLAGNHQVQYLAFPCRQRGQTLFYRFFLS